MSFVNQYTRTDRLLHKLAFTSQGIQVSLADIEDRLYKKQLSKIAPERPVFITALPRAGTTILLNVLHGTGEFFCHTYREMPFILCPLVWRRLSGKFRQGNTGEIERAHGDGLTISPDSPEAFEEMIWREFWAPHYREDRIEPWKSCDRSQFVDFFTSHLKKLALMNQRDSINRQRYISKNNLNIARVAALKSLFPDALFFIPFRNPIQHASSLLNQHLRFLKSHRLDDFSSTYMRGIGHYDFGDNLLPVNFGKWLEGDRRSDATKLSFWFEYWVATYKYLLPLASEHIHLLPFDQLVDMPEAVLTWLSTKAGLTSSELLVNQAGTLRKGKEHIVNTDSVEPVLLENAQALFTKLNAASSFRG